MRQIPLLIQNHESQAAAKQDNNRRYCDALREAGIREEVLDQAAFATMQARTPTLLHDISQQIAKHSKERDTLVLECAGVKRDPKRRRKRIPGPCTAQGNLPEWMAELRRNLCSDLRLPEKELSFAAEIISVKPEERAWESSIEMVLHSFALSLLVPQRYYHVVSSHVDAKRVADSSGRGQRLVYLRVGERASSSARRPPHGQSLVSKLAFREGHPLLPWVKAELEERFDFLCCNTPDEFQAADGLAMTRNRHVKFRGVRHEKDDRDKIADPRYFVLGWDNREKRRRLAEEIARGTDQRDQLDRRISKVEQEVTRLRSRETAVGRIQEFKDFGEINYAVHVQGDSRTPSREEDVGGEQ